ncbi:MAG: ribonuclease Z [Nitrospirota bacterium]
MKPTFHADPVNGPFEDSCIFIRILRERRALLFDLGSIGRLGAASLLKISDVFITHTHIDHFIGFDTLLRNILRKETPLRIFGPEPIISCVEGKLNGYTWNLIRDYPLEIEVFEVRNGTMAHASFHAARSFERVDHPATNFEGMLLRGPLFTIKGIILSHEIPVMAYSLEEDFHINIDKAVLAQRGLPVGPWLSDFKKAIREGAPADTVFTVEDRRLTLEEVRDIATITRGQKVSYVTDVSPTDDNIEKIIPFVSGSDQLFCEAYFLERDRERAIERHHLTAALAGKIAREAKVGHLDLLHFSPKYRDTVLALYQEAMREFRGPASRHY